MSDEELHYAVLLWPTPWYFRILGFKAWRFRQELAGQEYWVYVNSVHEIKYYKPIRRKARG